MVHGTFVSEEEFLAAYDEHADAVFRHCYLRTLDNEKSKELMCEAFQRLWLFIADGNYVDSLKSFVFRAANALICEAKADAQEMKEVSPVHASMISALQKIPSPQRAPFLLHSLEGFSVEEITDILGGNAVSHAASIENSRAIVSSHVHA